MGNTQNAAERQQSANRVLEEHLQSTMIGTAAPVSVSNESQTCYCYCCCRRH
ncbi:hypothetical protein ACFOSW_26255 [Paenibacillus sp. GCM10012303]